MPHSRICTLYPLWSIFGLFHLQLISCWIYLSFMWSVNCLTCKYYDSPHISTNVWFTMSIPSYVRKCIMERQVNERSLLLHDTVPCCYCTWSCYNWNSHLHNVWRSLCRSIDRFCDVSLFSCSYLTLHGMVVFVKDKLAVICEGSSSGQFWGCILSFDWQDWVIPQNLSTLQADNIEHISVERKMILNSSTIS